MNILEWGEFEHELEVDILKIKSKVCGSEDNREEGDVGLWEGGMLWGRGWGFIYLWFKMKLPKYP